MGGIERKEDGLESVDPRQITGGWGSTSGGQQPRSPRGPFASEVQVMSFADEQEFANGHTSANAGTDTVVESQTSDARQSAGAQTAGATSMSTQGTGVRLSKYCMECGFKFLQDNHKFCGECGLKRETIP